MADEGHILRPSFELKKLCVPVNTVAQSAVYVLNRHLAAAAHQPMVVALTAVPPLSRAGRLDGGHATAALFIVLNAAHFVSRRTLPLWRRIFVFLRDHSPHCYWPSKDWRRPVPGSAVVAVWSGPALRTERSVRGPRPAAAPRRDEP